MTSKQLVYIGSYTQPVTEPLREASGIHMIEMDPATGKMTLVNSFESGSNPSFVFAHPRRPFVYAVNELVEGHASAFAIDPDTHRLTHLNTQPTRGAEPCYICCDPAGEWLFVANYTGGSLAVFPIMPDGSLGPLSDLVQHHGSSVHPFRQTMAHLHSAQFDPSGQYLLTADLGIDKIVIYRFDRQTGKLSPHEPSDVSALPGSGPRHFVFHPNRRWMYLANELSSTVTAHRWDSQRGVLTPFKTAATLPDDFTGTNIVAEIRLSPSGKHLYVSNRGHDSLTVFAVDEHEGLLEFVENTPTLGHWPRNFQLDPSGHVLICANQQSDSLVTFWVDPQTGKLTPTGETLEIHQPVYVKFI